MNSQNRRMPQLGPVIKEALGIVLFAVVVALLVNGLRSDGLSWFGPADGDNEILTAGEISLDEAITMYRSGSAIFADARLPQDYAVGHIQGALNLDIQNPATWVDEFLARMPPETVLITYCDGPHCPLARELAMELTMMGFDRTYYLTDGWLKWQQKTMPTAVGEKE